MKRSKNSDALDAAEFAECAVQHRLQRLYVPSFCSSIDGMTTPAWIDSTTWIMSGACVAIRSQSISPPNSASICW